MGLLDFGNTTDALRDLLEKERDAILTGRFDLLERLAAEKERLVKLVSRDQTDANLLAKLREKTERNGQLLAAMRDGIRAAQDRVRKLQKGAEPLQTYDPTGQIHSIEPAKQVLTHRA